MKLDVIGGKADGIVFDEPGALIVSRSIAGDKYIAIEFPPDPKDKRKTVTIYMLTGTTPSDAIKIWRERNMKQTEEQWERLCDTARSLINAPASVVAEDPENFLAMIDISLAAIEAAKMRVGRGGLILELGDKRKDIREHPERYKNLSGGVEGLVGAKPTDQRRHALPRVGENSAKSGYAERGSSAPPAQNLQDADVGGMLCPECSGVEVHNDNCSQKNLPVPVLAETDAGCESRGESGLHDADQLARVAQPETDCIASENTSRGGQNLSDKDDEPW